MKLTKTQRALLSRILETNHLGQRALLVRGARECQAAPKVVKLLSAKGLPVKYLSFSGMSESHYYINPFTREASTTRARMVYAGRIEW